MKLAALAFASLTIMALIASPAVLERVSAQVTVYIYADGSIYPPSAPVVRQPNSERYYLTSDLTGFIAVYRKGISLDGTSHTLQGGVFVYNDSIKIYNFKINVVLVSNAILCETGRNHTFHNNQITGAKYGIQLNNSQGLPTAISNNNFINCQNGISIAQCDQIRIDGNTFSNGANNPHGIVTDRSNSLTIVGNSFNFANGFGIVIDPAYSSSSHLVENNKVAGASIGLLVSASNSTVNSNNISLATDTGLSIRGNNNTITNNLLANCTTGLSLSGQNNLVSKNNITMNSFGLSTAGGNNQIFLNNFIKNPVQVSTSTPHDAFDNGTRGNYWSNYNGTDANSDGVGDAPFVISEFNIDRYPLMTAVTITMVPELLPSTLILTLLMVSSAATFILGRQRKRPAR